MTPEAIREISETLPSNLPCRHFKAGAVAWLKYGEAVRSSGGSLLSLWGADACDRNARYRVYAAYLEAESIGVVEHEMDCNISPTYPSLAEIFPCAMRMERAIFDLLGIKSMEADHRGWLRHCGWPRDVFPLRRDFDANPQERLMSEPYPFVQVEGEGVHEIAVGPVHAGIIEPGHFRFSVVGEKVLRLEERLGYKHKGIAKRFEQMTQQQGYALAARISGDSAVAYSWAYCAALEAITGTPGPPRAAQLRALALEHERIANHLGDLGALGNDAGFAFGLTHFSRLKEDLLRTNEAVFGARYLMDFIVPGGVAGDLSEDAYLALLGRYAVLEREVLSLRDIYDNHPGLQDRFREAGVLPNEFAVKLNAAGLAARASGIERDLRVNLPWSPYQNLELKMITQTAGDVAARVAVRFDEVFASIDICRTLLSHMPDGSIRCIVPDAEPDRLGLGIIEAWRGPVLIALEAGPHGSIRRCHAHDPSWQNWPLLEYAVLGNIVPDFPLINKSFNLSYSGHDG